MDFSHDAWVLITTAVAGVLTLTGVIVTAYFSYKGVQASKRAESSASHAATLSTPTGNGWAERVDKKLDHVIRITAETRQIAVQANETIQDHVNAHVAAQLNIPVRRVK